MKRIHVHRMLTLVLGLLVLALVGLGPVRGMQERSSVEASASPHSLVEPSESWVTYVNTDYGFSLQHPSEWAVGFGNGHAPSLPASIVTLKSELATFDVTIISLHNAAGYDGLRITRQATAGYWGDLVKKELTTKSIEGAKVARAVYVQPPVYGITVQLVLTTFTRDNTAYMVLTQAATDPALGVASSRLDLDRLAVYEKIVESFTLLPQGPQRQLPVVPASRESDLREDSAGMMGLKAVAAVFQWPSNGYIGYIYRRPVSYAAYHNGIDIWTNKGGSGNQGSKGNAVYPPYSGKVTAIYTDPRGAQQGIRVEHGNVGGTNLWTHYWHMADESTGQSYIEGGLLWQQVDANRLLGYQGNRRWSGGDIIVHLHLTVANGSADSNDIDPSPYFDTKLNWNDPGHIGWHHYVERSGSSPPPCPTSGGVILHKHAGYDCGGEGEGRGYVRQDGAGWKNVGGDFNDQASSVRVPSGWSVKLFEHNDRSGARACRTGDDDNFAGDRFNDSSLSLNDNVSSFEVFHDSRCGEPVNRPPNTPSPQSPGDWHVARDGRAPTLCWNNPGDPDGNQLEFYAEVYESAVNANSGWTSNTCWRPSQLDGRYYGYKWRVKARDVPHHAESGWSTTWHFNIEAPNEPPRISFDTANGNGDSQITSRERNWTFRGTASDAEGRLDRVEFRCNGDNCGSGPDRTGGDNWSLTRNDMAGRNDVYFVAFDDKQSTASRHLDLRIDLAGPVTTLSLNNEANPARWPAWFREPVQVRLKAEDGNTGRARVGVFKIYYRLDGGYWQNQTGDTVTFPVSSDGAHTVEYYAVDWVGNQEPAGSVTFRIDQTPPSPPGGVVETHGVVSGQWQKAHNTPTFTWTASSDATSGVWGYQFYFGPDPNGVAYQTFLASDPREWTPQLGGVRTGTYYLRGRTRDNAGNWSAWTDLFTFRYDGTPPENPKEATHAAGIANDTWQRITNVPDFTWPAPHDEGSGIKGYYHYWGTDPAGTSGDFTTNTQYQIPNPLCGTNEACTGYLRLRSMDNVDNVAEDWSTAFVLRYDNAPPTADFTFNGGVTQTTQTLVTLHITAEDQGSGVREMRLSGDGRNWTSWEVYSTRRPWTIPGISRQWWPVYLQVRDGVELASEVISHTIYLDVNPQQPRSASFRLFDHVLSAGAGAHTSAPSGYQGRSTLGQVVDSDRATSLNYVIVGGYEAGSQALPIEEPGHDEFTFINGIFASGTGADTLQSSLYQILGTVGEVGLPNNETTLSSQGHRHQPGFLAAAPPSGTPTPTPTPGPTQTPEPTPACEFPRISINNAALFTNDPNVTLNICAPRAREMMLSNDGGFVGATWEPYAETRPWTITTYGQYVLPRFVYAAFKDADGTVHSTYFDDIIYDPNPPQGTIAVGDSVLASGGAEGQRGRSPEQSEGTGAEVLSSESVKYVQRLGGTVLTQPVALLGANADGTVDVYINARDDNSGLAEMQVSGSVDFSDTDWEPYSALKPWMPEGGDGIKMVYGRFRDGAGNVSTPAEAQFVLDTLPPLGGIALDRRVVGPDIITTTVYLGAEDNLSGVTDMRVSEDPNFSDAAWQPYTTTLTWPISLTAQTEGTLYVQYRDLAGNVSEVYSDTYLVDRVPPMVYVEVAPGDTLTRNVTVLAYDELAGVATMHLSNDPLMIEGVVTLPYTDTVEWVFDERRVVWVQVEDSVGNVSEPYPALARPACPEDLVGYDSLITVADIQAVVAYWRQDLGFPYDRNGDNRVTATDAMWYASRWGQGCP